MEFSLLIMSAFPSGLATFLYLIQMLMLDLRQTKVSSARGGFSGQSYLTFYLVVLGIIVVGDILIFDVTFLLNPIDFLAVTPIVLGGTIIAFLLELSVTYLLSVMRRIKTFFTNRKRILTNSSKKISESFISGNVHQSSYEIGWLKAGLFFIFVPIFEELLFRGVLFSILNGIDLLIVLFVTSGLFALTHVTFGLRTVAQKMLVGLVLGATFILTNLLIIVPISIHILENILVVLYIQFELSRKS